MAAPSSPKAATEQRSPIVLLWVLTCTGQECTTTLRNGHIQVDDQAAADTVFGYLTFPDPVFPVVTPRVL
ncbi:hypothetical protein [Streptomyces syringium]|uniref:hypothetical protein n=1 Tax=Streptomyces syringium TaxID=76729 RepID=UPI0033C514DC